MRITISGKPGSGKSTVAKILARKLKLKYYSVGNIMKEIASELGISLIELNKISEQDNTLDNFLDSYQKQLNKRDNFILDSRLGFHFIKKSIKIFLDVDIKEAAKRIIKQKRDVEKARTIKEMETLLKKRIKSEVKRYKKLYNINHLNKNNYDIIIDTTDKNQKQVVGIIIKKLFKK